MREREGTPGGRFGAGIRALYVSPLRALTYDIQKNLERPLREMGLLADPDDPKADGIRLGLRTGDTDARERARLRRRPPHLLLTTPETLAILLAQGAWQSALAACRFVVVDELHALAENKRGAHLSVSLERLERLRGTADAAGLGLVRIGLSATVGEPATAARFLVGTDRPCAIAAVAGRRAPELTVFSPVRGHPYTGFGGGRRAGEILAETARRVRAGRSTVVFANTRSGAERFGLALRGALPALADRIEVHHGSLDRSVRLEVEDRLKDGDLRAVVCSTSLEMGVDIGSVDLAVLLSPPKSVARTLQRVGRAGHAVGAVSRGVLMARGVDELLEAAVTARLARDGRLEPLRVPENPLDVLAQHVVGLAMAEPGIAVAEVRRVVTAAFPFRRLPEDEFLRVVEFLEGGGRSLARQYAETFGKIVRRPDPATGEPGLWTTGKRVERDYLFNVGTIATEGLVDVVQVSRRRRLGSLDERFVQGLTRGDVFVLGGQTLRFLETDAASGAARVEPAAPGERPTVPSWSAARQSLPRGLAAELAAVRAELDARLDADPGETGAAEWLSARLDPLAVDNARAVVRQFLLQRRVSAVPRPGRIVVEIFRETAAEFGGPDPRRGPTLRRGRRERAGLVPVALSHHFVHTGLGRAGNDALARIAAWRVNRIAGGNALAAADDGGFLLTLRREQELPAARWRDEVFARAGAAEDLAGSLRDSELVRGQFRAVAQTGLMVPRRLPGAERRVRHLRFSGEVLFKVLGQYEPDHPLVTEAYRQATHAFLDADDAVGFLDRLGNPAENWEWRFVELSAVSPFGFPLFASRMKESLTLEDPDTAVERLYRELQAQNPDESAGGTQAPPTQA